MKIAMRVRPLFPVAVTLAVSACVALLAGCGRDVGGAEPGPPHDAAAGGSEVAVGAGDSAGATTDANAGDSPPGDAPPREHSCVGGKPRAGLPAAAPTLEAGTWKNISPPGVPWRTTDGFAQGMALHPCDPAVIYLCVGGFDTAKAGLYKTEDAGATWRVIGRVKPNFTGVDHLDEPIRVRVDPDDPLHMYVGDGVRGGTGGFWVSKDGGETFDMPASFAKLNFLDVYDVAPDPDDFNHVLVSFHSPWDWDANGKYHIAAGVLESKDGGTTWIQHDPPTGWGFGHAINFLYRPELGLGDSRTWLLGTQGAGMWRTTDAGGTWTKVTDTSIQHGGGTVYYSKTGVLYASGADHNARSTNNGASWTTIGPGGGYNAVGGDGQRLYTAKVFGPAPFMTSPESDGVTWTEFSAQQVSSGGFEILFDAVNGIVYSASWGEGLLALKVR